MRALWIVLVACLGIATAWTDEPDPLLEGRDLLRGPKKERGVALLRKVIGEGKAAPRDARKQQRAGRAHFYLDEDIQAVAAIERAQALEPKNARHAFWLGAVWLNTDVDKSLAAFERALALDRDDADVWFGLGRARDRKKDLPAALTAFLKAVELDPEYTEAHYRAGKALHRSERNAEAIVHYRKALALDATHVDAGNDLGLLEYLAGRFEGAREVWLAIEPHAPDDLELRARIVQALFALERYAEAEPWREKVRRMHATSKDEGTRKLREYCFDQFAVDDLRVVALEQFDRSEDALYRYVFRVSRDGTEILRVNLEPTPVAKELGLLGGGFFLGANDDEGHVTFQKRWNAEPPYPELKAAVIDAIHGRLAAASRSRTSPQRPPAEKVR